MANEASIGMYYIQNHNINVIESIADDKVSNFLSDYILIAFH